MRATQLLCLAPVLLGAPRVLGAGPIAGPVVALAGEEEEKPDKRPEVKELLERLAAHIKRRGGEDRDAIVVIDEIVKEFPKSGPKDRAAVASGVG